MERASAVDGDNRFLRDSILASGDARLNGSRGYSRDPCRPAQAPALTLPAAYGWDAGVLRARERAELAHKFLLSAN
jgi:hypothetical protein